MYKILIVALLIITPILSQAPSNPNGQSTFSSGNASLDSAMASLYIAQPASNKNFWPFMQTSADNLITVIKANWNTAYFDFWNVPNTGTVYIAVGSRVVHGIGTHFTTDFCQGPGSPTVAKNNLAPIIWYPLNDGSGRTGRRIAGYPVSPGPTYVASCTDDTTLTVNLNNWYASTPGACTLIAPCQYSTWNQSLAGNLWGFGSSPAGYYDVGAGIYAQWYRTASNNDRDFARQFVDRIWASPEYDYGNAFDDDYPLGQFCQQFRCTSLMSIVLRALDTGDNHPDMWVGLHKFWKYMGMNNGGLGDWLNNFPNGYSITALDAREWGYGLAQMTYCANFDTSATYRQMCRNYIKATYLASGSVPGTETWNGVPLGALNVWPRYKSSDNSFANWFSPQQSGFGANHITVTTGSNIATCATATCPSQSYLNGNSGACGWSVTPCSLVFSTMTTLANCTTPGDNNCGARTDTVSFCDKAATTNCTVSGNTITLDRAYDGDPSCTLGCSKNWVVGNQGPAMWGQEPFFEGILSAAFDLAGRAMKCITTGNPLGCDDNISTIATNFANSTAQWYMTYGWWSATNGAHYYVQYPGCLSPIPDSYPLCNALSNSTGGGPYNGNPLASREFAADGFRGLMLYYYRTRDATAKTILDKMVSCLWAKAGTGAGMSCNDATYPYDSSFDYPGGFWMSNNNSGTQKEFGQILGFGSMASWSILRQGSVTPSLNNPTIVLTTSK